MGRTEHAAPELLTEVLRGSTGKDSRVHGPDHWAAVAVAGLTLLDLTPDADPFVVLLFALFHDSMRLSDGRDPEHGARAARYARELRDAGAYSLDEGRLAKLEDALIRHDRGETSADPNTAVCWDADRLNLPRVAIKPSAAYMSTTAGRGLIGTTRAKYFPLFLFDWETVFREYEAKMGTADLPGGPVYLRFGDLPEHGRSRFASYTVQEDGVSAYHGYEAGPNSYLIDARRMMLGTDTRLVRLLLSQSRPLYVVEGTLIGMGGSGEPVLSEARIVGEVGPEDVLEVLPHRPKIAECVEWWRASRGGADPGPFPQPLTPLPPDLPCDRPATLRATYAAMHDFEWFAGEFKRRLRDQLERRGALEDYERMKADWFGRPKRPPPSEAFDPWASLPEPWRPPPEPAWLKQWRESEEQLERWREFDEQQRAMSERYERMGGGFC